jgi:hypothetical protein
MWERNAVAHPRRPELFALKNLRHYLLGIQPEFGCRPGGKLTEKLSFVACAHVEHHISRREKIADLHRRSNWREQI